MLNSLPDEVMVALKPGKEGITLIITVGNTMRTDDGVGPYIASRFTFHDSHFTLINVGEHPERAADEAEKIKPAKVVIIDAADFGGKPGEARIIPNDAIPETTMSTHTFPLKIIAKIIEKDTGSPVYFLGIQPAKMGLGEDLSLEVKQTAEEIVQCMKFTY